MLDANGSVWSVGYNGSGQFGLNNTSNYYLPQKCYQKMETKY